jgi:NAD(P)-dependent dehydrogenase (short-subunit alcohol dehydrogenase family)
MRRGRCALGGTVAETLQFSRRRQTGYDADSFQGKEQRCKMELEERVALITGAAGGIGEATARLFAREGAGLALVDLESRRMETLRKELEGLATEALILQADVSQEQQVRGGEAVNEQFASNIPKRRYRQPEEVARAILFLASEQAGYITGEILDVNGGLVMD